MQPEPRLNSSKLVQERLHKALYDGCDSRDGTKFTLIPAAVGAADGWLELFDAPKQLIRGGGLPMRKRLVDASTQHAHHRVRAIDFPSWLAASFTPADHVVLKMDIEGAEFACSQADLTKFALVRRIDLEKWATTAA